jgi:hypothetical protein
METPKLFLFTLLFAPLLSLGQVARELKSAINSNKVGKTINRKSKENESELTFLGTVNTDYGKTKYYVLKEFLNVRAASTWHGHSSIYFIDLQFKKSIRYDLGMPRNLPYKLSHDRLLFKYKDNAMVKNYWQDLKPRLISDICVAPSECYPPSN